MTDRYNRCLIKALLHPPHKLQQKRTKINTDDQSTSENFKNTRNMYNNALCNVTQ